jgi:site-specific recombinase XerD
MRNKFPQAMHDAQISETWQEWLASRQRGLEASNRAAKTQRAYELAMIQLGKFCAWKEYTTDPLSVTRSQIEEFMILTRQSHSAYTVQSYYEGIKRFYTWLIQEDEITVHPMDKMKLPKVPESDREVMTPEHIQALMRTCAGNDFLSRRDMAIFYILIDTGLRLNELASITISNVDLREKVIHIPPLTSKGGRVRDVPIGAKATAALDRYLRKRASHPLAESPQLWLGQKGELKAGSIYWMISERCRKAGLPHTFPHLFRHTFAHMWLSDEGSEGDLKAIGGWTSNIVERYGRKLKGDRARNAHKLHSPGDKL